MPPEHGMEPQFVSFDDALVGQLVEESQRLQPDGCCSADSWRGHLCQYHQGYEDALSLVQDRLRDRRDVFFRDGG